MRCSKHLDALEVSRLSSDAMGNAITWEPKELAYLQSREWDVMREKLHATDMDITNLLKVFREINYKGNGLIGRIEFYLHFKYPFITPMADKLFHAFADGKKDMTFRDFCASVFTMALATVDTLINFLFDMYDLDKNKVMDKDELKECLEDVFGPPEQAEWFSILNECTRSLVNKYTRMGSVELSRKMFREMIRSNEPLMTCVPLVVWRGLFAYRFVPRHQLSVWPCARSYVRYLPVFVLQRDMISKTLGARVFNAKPVSIRLHARFGRCCLTQSSMFNRCAAVLQLSVALTLRAIAKCHVIVSQSTAVGSYASRLRACHVRNNVQNQCGVRLSISSGVHFSMFVARFAKTAAELGRENLQAKMVEQLQAVRLAVHRMTGDRCAPLSTPHFLLRDCNAE